MISKAKGMNYCTSLYMYEKFSLLDAMLTVLFTTTNIAHFNLYFGTFNNENCRTFNTLRVGEGFFCMAVEKLRPQIKSDNGE